jgi:hypothetical protein
MTNDPRPLRQLSRVERLKVRLGRCPTCHKRLTSVCLDQAAGWSDAPVGVGMSINQHVASSYGRSRVGHIAEVQRLKVPHCPRCSHTFVHGWIYPDGD